MAGHYRKSGVNFPKVLSVGLGVALVACLSLASRSWAGCPSTESPTPKETTPRTDIPERAPTREIPTAPGAVPFDGLPKETGGITEPQEGKTVKMGGIEYVVGKDGNLISKQELENKQKAADLSTKAGEMYESAKQYLKALKERSESAAAQAYQTGADKANALASIASDAGNKVNDIFTSAKDTVEAKRKAVGESLQQKVDQANEAAEGLMKIADLYAKAHIQGAIEDGKAMADISEKLRAGDCQGAKDASIIAANKKLVDSFKDPAISKIVEDTQAAVKGAEQKLELELKLQRELGLNLEKIQKIETNIRERKAKDMGLSPEKVKVANYEIELSARLYKAFETNPVIMPDNATIEQGAKVYYEGARAYVEEINGVKVPSADSTFGETGKR